LTEGIDYDRLLIASAARIVIWDCISGNRIIEKISLGKERPFPHLPKSRPLGKGDIARQERIIGKDCFV